MRFLTTIVQSKMSLVLLLINPILGDGKAKRTQRSVWDIFDKITQQKKTKDMEDISQKRKHKWETKHKKILNPVSNERTQITVRYHFTLNWSAKIKTSRIPSIGRSLKVILIYGWLGGETATNSLGKSVVLCCKVEHVHIWGDHSFPFAWYCSWF